MTPLVPLSAGMRDGARNTAEMLRALLAAIPIVALTFAVPFVNRIEPRFLGLPFLLAWIMVWVLLTPAFLWMVAHMERR